MYFCAISPSSPIQNELYLATPDFSLFVLELPFPDRKAKVKFHYSFWNFHSQIEKRKPIGQNKLLLATAHFFIIRFGTSIPKSKSVSYIHYLFWNFRSQIKKRKLICHNLFWNKPKSRPPFVLEVAKFPNRKADAKTERSLTCKVPAHCRVNAASGRWSYGRDLCRVTYEGIHVHRLTSLLNIHKAF